MNDVTNNLRSFARKAGAPPLPATYEKSCERLALAWLGFPGDRQDFMRKFPDLYWALAHFATWRNIGAK